MIGREPTFEASFAHARRVIQAEAEELGLELPPIQMLPDEPVVCDFTLWREDTWVTDGATRFDLRNRKMTVQNATYLTRVLANTSLASHRRAFYVIHSLQIAFDCDPEKVA